MFDSYDILSGGVRFSHKFEHEEDWISEISRFSSGTIIWMKIDNHTARTSKRIFDQYTTGVDYGFNKTVVPVRLAQYGEDLLVSRSQEKRILARIELLKTVIFVFKEYQEVCQAFADEIYHLFTY